MKHKQDPSAIPQVKSVPTPVVQNARIYLLSGKKDSVQNFDSLRKDLVAGGFNVIGAKNLDDPGRPNEAEIRYFNGGDNEQAQELADFMTSLLGKKVPANKYGDPSAKPGYIEIWLGR